MFMAATSMLETQSGKYYGSSQREHECKNMYEQLNFVIELCHYSLFIIHYSPYVILNSF